MPNGVNTNPSPLYAIRQALVEFREDVNSINARCGNLLQNIDEQIYHSANREITEIEERQRKGSDEGRTDSFACDTCGGRIMLLIRDDSSHCRESGCRGTIRRVYTDSTYSSSQRQRDIDELQEIKQLLERYSRQKEDFAENFSRFVQGAGDTRDASGLISSAIIKLEDYLNLDITVNLSSGSQSQSGATRVVKDEGSSGKAHDIQAISKWLGKINPNYNNPFIPIRNPYRVNCGSCAFAVNARMDGDTSAAASKTNIGTDAAMEQATGKTCRYMSTSEIEDHLITQGPGAHCIVGINRSPTPQGRNQSGHWFNAYYDGNQFYTVDGQTGSVYDWPHDYGDISEWCALV